jgi:CDP-diacylglycerol--glycerol-3-phosphate 3-phosphatidyltransferase
MTRAKFGTLFSSGLTAFRLLLAVIVIVLALNGRAGLPYIACLALAFISDYFDGVVARHYGVDTASLRRFDSLTDVVFYLAAFTAVIILYPDLLYAQRYGIATVLSILLIRIITDQIKFRREASYHMLSAKAWGISLLGALVVLAGFGKTGLSFQTAVILGIITQLEGLAASLILPQWTHDVLTIYHAYQIRQQLVKD